VGCGGISRSHATAYAHLGAASLVAVCDIDPERLQVRATEFEVPGRYTDYREMFARERLDVVSVCTHAPLHADVACAAADAGIHVLCEKPLALELESADRMVAHCAAAGVQLAVSHQFRFTPALRTARRLVAEGRIGTLRCVREVGKGRPAGFELMEMGVHYFDELAFFLDGIDWVHARVTFRGREAEVGDIMHSSELCTTDPRDNGMVAGDTMLIQVGGSRGASGLVELYQRATRDGWIAGPHLLGERGQLLIKGSPQSSDYELWYCPSDVSFAAHTPAWERVEIPAEAYLIEGRAWPGHPSIWSVRDMLQALVEGRRPELGGAHAAGSLECVSAVYESHFTGARATLPLAERGHPLVRRLAAPGKNAT
jgi:predicted dehydrogenase